MLNILYHLFTIFKIFIGLTMFTYLHKIILEGCTYKKNLLVPNEKSKVVSKTKVGLYFLYLVLSMCLYYLISFYVLFVLAVGFTILGLTIIHKTSVETLKVLDKWDSEPKFKKCWEYYSFVVNGLSKIFKPIHSIINSYVEKLKREIADIFISKYINSQVRSFSEPDDVAQQFNKMKEILEKRPDSFNIFEGLNNVNTLKITEFKPTDDIIEKTADDTNSDNITSEDDDLSSFINDGKEAVEPIDKKND
jgi:hypothetical protein